MAESAPHWRVRDAALAANNREGSGCYRSSSGTNRGIHRRPRAARLSRPVAKKDPVGAEGCSLPYLFQLLTKRSRAHRRPMVPFGPLLPGPGSVVELWASEARRNPRYPLCTV